MRAFCIVMVLLLVFTGCGRQKVKTPDAAKQPSPMVIDYPAGIMVTPGNQASADSKQKFSLAEKILLPQSIPVIGVNTRQLEFVKQNGDRISIALNDLAGKYDIILFDAVNNPVPLRIADLQGALDQLFNFPSSGAVSQKKRKHTSEKTVTTNDNPDRKISGNRLQQLKRRDRKIVVTKADTSTQKLETRIIPGIQWVEQRVDTRKILTVDFANDIITYANTDRYFTNGITIGLQAAWLGGWKIQKLMLPYNHKANLTYTISLVQDMYTPTDTRVAPSLENDRPYASYLYVGFRKITSDPLRRLKLSSELDLGYLGPYSPGSYFQSLVHKTFPANDAPQGWDTQISTDIILNYGVRFEKALLYKENISILARMEGNIGTLYTNAGAGLQMQAGKAEPVFGLAENEKWPGIQYYFFAKTNISFVAYNALLQGGTLNHDNVYTLQGNEIQHVVGDAQAGIHFRYRNTGIELAQHYLTPEYKGGLWHKWGRVSVLIGL